ncbi:uncharacterized protein BX663DRAFT_492047 [Cokeromyces recurvatus]|uniref:uncharacterized protein n=1 Tax=Cokeromyces recurvatus TaxID=90255 RepID=UPI00222048CC|nr:uncharacterized protein BX663DRAFT_492047 [Cokeromyces recurvatus]KAI7907806.1 hypothetical protein BX663DRAFT_492047 [Cokeromyces recurvatus]
MGLHLFSFSLIASFLFGLFFLFFFCFFFFYLFLFLLLRLCLVSPFISILTIVSCAFCLP